MELDNFKNSWNSISVDLNSNEFDVVSATKKEMESPLSNLKIMSKRQLITLPLLIVFLAVMTATVPDMKKQLLVWMAFIVLPLTTIYYYFNLKLINNLENSEGAVKNDFQRKVKQLISNNNLYLNLTRAAILILVVTTEILLQNNNMGLIYGIEIIKSIILPLRLLIYAGVIAVHYVVSRYSFNLYFGQYLKRLKGLLAEME
ncbi:hypothetical protein [Pedobacter roseus]|uniref:Uncharacterized protein n=1 Tax=Pedobacter roseus TaxID=336820 RepID=A0A7G9QGE3_9SPHI|nr:hypothetical protein [Pedobacter roseus]QNN42418.1 hypothetical protein H9L23_25660 [Pedobacter roseus]